MYFNLFKVQFRASLSRDKPKKLWKDKLLFTRSTEILQDYNGYPSQQAPSVGTQHVHSAGTQQIPSNGNPSWHMHPQWEPSMYPQQTYKHKHIIPFVATIFVITHCNNKSEGKIFKS